jgi:hypothetical protein
MSEQLAQRQAPQMPIDIDTFFPSCFDGLEQGQLPLRLYNGACYHLNWGQLDGQDSYLLVRQRFDPSTAAGLEDQVDLFWIAADGAVPQLHVAYDYHSSNGTTPKQRQAEAKQAQCLPSVDDAVELGGLLGQLRREHAEKTMGVEPTETVSSTAPDVLTAGVEYARALWRVAGFGVQAYIRR